MLVKLIDGRVKDVPVTEVTKENYIVPKGQEKLYHCIIEVRKFDPNTGVRLSTPRLQKFGIKTFEGNIYEGLRKQGYEVTILHNPNEYLAEENAKKIAEEEQKAKDAEQAMIAEAEAQKQAEIDKAVKEALAKQKAEYEKKLADRSKPKDDAPTEEKTEETTSTEAEHGEETASKRGRKAKTE